MQDGDSDSIPTGDFSERAKEIAARLADEARQPLSEQETLRLLHELEARKGELELQNSQLRRAQAELELKRTRWSNLYDLAPVGYCTLNEKGQILEANLATAQLLGEARGALIHQSLVSYIVSEDQDIFLRRREQLLDTGTPQGFDLRLKRKAGASFWAWVESRVAQETDGSLSFYIALNNINALKQAEAELRRLAAELEHRVARRTADLKSSEEGLRQEIERRIETEVQLVRSEGQLRAILDAAAEAIITIDLKGDIESFNDAAERMFGWSASEAIGKSVSILIPKPEAQEHGKYLERYLITGVPHVIGIGREVTALRKDGSTFPVSLSVSDVLSDHSRKFTGILRDLSERNRLEAQFRQAQKMEGIGRLASGIAHDFNNLLMGEIGCCNAARALLCAEHAAVLPLAEAKDAAERGAGLTRQLLSFGRQQPSVPTSLQLNDIVKRVVSMLRKVLGEDIRLELELCVSGGPIFGEPSSLEQILMNLAVNARDAMKQGGRLRIATMELELEEARQTRSGLMPPGRYIALEVEDSGCGIPPEIQERVFEPFFTTKPVGEGTGLGLYSVYGIVDQIGGAVEFESEVGRGTRFTILLPRQEARAQPIAAESTKRPAIGAAAESSARKTILVVEDEPLIRAALKQMLAAERFNVLMAKDFDDAQRVAALHPRSIDLLLTDMVLPGGSGSELAAAMQSTHPGLRVVFMSAYPTELLVQQGRIPAGTSSLEKPFDDEQLESALQHAFAGAD